MSCSARLTDTMFLKGRDVWRVTLVVEPVISKNRNIVVSESSALFKQLNTREVVSNERKLCVAGNFLFFFSCSLIWRALKGVMKARVRRCVSGSRQVFGWGIME